MPDGGRGRSMEHVPAVQMDARRRAPSASCRAAGGDLCHVPRHGGVRARTRSRRTLSRPWPTRRYRRTL